MKKFIGILFLFTIVLSAFIYPVTSAAVIGANPTASFGIGLKYDNGTQPAVAINNNGKIVEVHKSQAYNKLWYHTGQTKQMDVIWSPSYQYDDGITPAVALNDQGLVVEVHQSQGSATLWYHVGQLSGDKVNWGGSNKYDTGITPAVALDKDGWCVEVHKSEYNSGLWYRVGQVCPGNQIFWGPSRKYDNGCLPKIALINQGIIVEVHQSQGAATLWYHVGTIDKKNLMINWGPSFQYDNGFQPSVALNDSGVVIETHSGNNALYQRRGLINGYSVNWGESVMYEKPYMNTPFYAPSVAANNAGVAIQTHVENLYTLSSSTSLITNQSNWMQDRRNVLKDKTLKQLVLPASHDAGMYLNSFPASLGQTQDLDIYQQLSSGIRYFDLRPRWAGSNFYICHTVTGPKLSAVLDDVKKYMNEGHHELVILKFSHYEKFSDEVYKKMVQLITDKIGPWLYTTKPDQDIRISDISLGDFLDDFSSGKVLVVCDENYPVDNPQSGIWVYRDATGNYNPEEGDLVVYDNYAETQSYDKMKGDQTSKFQNYNGYCTPYPFPCDLFLLSWTLTTWTDIWGFSKEANRNLGTAILGIKQPNNAGKIINLLYVDFAEDARVTDIAISLNSSFYPAGTGK